MVLSPDGRDLIRVEGRLAKNPSFWTSLVNIVRRYATLGGVRVPVSTETTAKIKFVGNSQLEVAYEYETVNGRPVNSTASVARFTTPQSSIFNLQSSVGTIDPLTFYKSRSIFLSTLDRRMDGAEI